MTIPAMDEICESPKTPAKRKRRWKRRIAATVTLLFIAINVIAFLQAHAMTHMVTGTHKTSSPQALSFFEKIKVMLLGVSVPRPENRRLPKNPFTTHHFATRDGETIEAWFIPAPESRGVIVMFHGYSTSKSVLLSTADVFRAEGFDTLLVDFRGSGGSTGNVTTIGYKEATDVAAAIELARSKLLPVGKSLLAYGDSMGAATIMRAISVEQVQLDGVILEQPYATLYATTKHRFESMGLPGFPLAGLLLFWGGVENGFSAFELRPVDYARDIRCPTLYIRGQGDPWIPIDESESIANALTCPKSIVTIQTNKHDSLGWRDPETWKAGVQAFLRDFK